MKLSSFLKPTSALKDRNDAQPKGNSKRTLELPTKSSREPQKKEIEFIDLTSDDENVESLPVSIKV